MAIEFARELREKDFLRDETYIALRKGEGKYIKRGKLDVVSVRHPANPSRIVDTTLVVPSKTYRIVPVEDTDGLFDVHYEERNPLDGTVMLQLSGRFDRHGLPLHGDAGEIKRKKDREQPFKAYA